MRTAKFSLNSSTPAFPREPSFYTQADLKMIIKSTFQEVLSSLMMDEETKEVSNEDQKKPEKLTVTVQEAANLLGVSKPTMFELLYNGSIAYKKIGRKIIISYKVLVDWVNENQ